VKLKIEGFKSIQHMEMDFGNINILLGGNGAGKSNLISFFEMLEYIKNYKLQSFVVKQGGANMLLYNGLKQTEWCNFYVSRECLEFHGRLGVTKADNLYFEQQGLYNYKEHTNYYAADGFQELKDDGLVSNMGVLDGIGCYHFHDTSDSSLMKAACSINDNVELASDGRNIAAILYLIKETDSEVYQYIVQMVRLVAPYFQTFILRRNPLNNERIRLEWIKKGCNIPFGPEQLSDGTLRFICLAVLLCQPEKMRKDVICIDEPELGLHPYAVTVLSELIKKYASSRQVLVATQSVELLNEFSEDDIIVIDNKDGDSVFRRLDKEYLNVWMKEYTLGDLWKKNIIGGDHDGEYNNFV
jgi:predicted ATPase